MSEENGDKPKRQLSPEAREKLSKLAKQRIAEGKMGPQFGKKGGRPRKDNEKDKQQRIARRVAEAAKEEENAKAIIQVFKDAIKPSETTATRLKAAQAWIQVEMEEGKLVLNEEKHELQQRDRDQMIKLLEERLTSGPAADILRRHIDRQIEQETGIVDAVVVEEE